MLLCCNCCSGGHDVNSLAGLVFIFYITNDNLAFVSLESRQNSQVMVFQAH